MSDTPSPSVRFRRRRAHRRRSSAVALLGLVAVLVPGSIGLDTGPARADVAPYGRTLAVEGLADPDVYKVDDNNYLLSGTSSQDFLPIYTSADLLTFTLLSRYDPDVPDDRHDYCQLWAPDLDKQGSDYVLHFVASRVKEGAPCPSDTSEQTIFYATAPDTGGELQFGRPHAVNPDTTAPRTYVTKGCPDDGCQQAMRLDPSVYSDGSRRWMHYAWFDPAAGVVVSAFPLDAPEDVFEVARPTTPAEQGVNEAPTLFNRDGQQYLFYSQGHYTDGYGMRYVMGDRVADLTDEHESHRFSVPLVAHDGRLLENQGHNTVTDRNGQFYVLYHVARFTPAGGYAGRDVYVQPLMFKADGSVNTLNTVSVHWSADDDSTYSLDVQTRDGEWVTSCLDAGAASSVTFTGVCTAAGDVVVHKSDITTFRINRIVDGETVSETTLAYDGFTDSLAATA